METSPVVECWDVALIEAINGKKNVDKRKNKKDGVDAFREAIKKKERVPSAHAPQDMVKDDIDWIDIEVFPDEVNKR